MKIEWVIVKGVSQFANDLDPPNNLWKSFACTMAASLVSNMLNDPLIFKNWPHFDGKCSSACLTALRCINPVYQQGFESTDMFVQIGGPHNCHHDNHDNHGEASKELGKIGGRLNDNDSSESYNPRNFSMNVW